MELTAGELRLRPWAERDADAVRRGLTDPEFTRWNSLASLAADPDPAPRWLRGREQAWRDGTQAAFAVTDAHDRVLGHVGLHHVELDMRCARVGYWVLPEARGRGVARRALEAATRWAFGTLGLHRLELGHALGNEPSCRVAAHCGYLLEGTLRGALVDAGGRPLDIHLHARVATDPAPDPDLLAVPPAADAREDAPPR